MPTAQVELGHLDESRNRIFHLRHRQEHLRVRHEAISPCQHSSPSSQNIDDHTHFVIRSSILLGSSMNVGSVTRLRSAPGRSCDIMCMRTFCVRLLVSSSTNGSSWSMYHVYDVPLPCSASTTVSSSVRCASLASASWEARLPTMPYVSRDSG